MFDIAFKIFSFVSGEGVFGLICLGLVALFVLGWKGKISRQIVPGLMTSLGIFGTFWGVFIALHPLDFAPEKMNDSIAALLEGMTTAFLTSLLGLGGAIVTRIFFGVISKAGDQKSSSPEHQDIANRLEAIKKAIAADDDSSLTTQMVKLRDENRDGFKKLDGLTETIRDALVKNLENLIREIRDIIGKQLGNSLKELVNAIQKALIDQFGATFRQFNDAVQALKKWQEDHRAQVEQLTAAFQETAKGIEKIRTDCEAIPPTAEKLREVVEAAKVQIDELDERLRAFADMKKQAEESFPTIKENLDKIGDDLKNSASAFAGLESTIKDIFDKSKAAAEQHHSDVTDLVAGMRSAMENAQKENADKVISIIKAAGEQFETQMTKEMNRVTREWGNDMVSIAERCAETIRAVQEQQRQ